MNPRRLPRCYLAHGHHTPRCPPCRRCRLAARRVPCGRTAWLAPPITPPPLLLPHQHLWHCQLLRPHPPLSPLSAHRWPRARIPSPRRIVGCAAYRAVCTHGVRPGHPPWPRDLCPWYMARPRRPSATAPASTSTAAVASAILPAWSRLPAGRHHPAHAAPRWAVWPVSSSQGFSWVHGMGYGPPRGSPTTRRTPGR